MSVETTYCPVSRVRVFDAIHDERIRQERLRAEGRFRYTPDSPDAHPFHKLAMLIEEVGEVAEALQQLPEPDHDAVKKELIQVAAIATAWLEGIFDAEHGGET